MTELLKNRIRAWAQQVAALASMRVPAAFEARRDALVIEARKIGDQIAKIWPGFETASLGAPILVVPVAIAGLIAAGITAWTLSYNKFMRELEAELERERREEFERLSAEVGPEVAAEIIERRNLSTRTPGFFGELGKGLSGVAGLGIAAVVAWLVLGSMR